MTGPDRARLADLLAEADPDAPTLCEGWDVRDLAVHLLVREGRPDAGAARALLAAVPSLRPAREHAERVEGQLEALPFAELVSRFRAGPPRWSPFAVPQVEALANGVEFYVHGQDVRRAAPSYDPDDPAQVEHVRPGQREALWSQLRRMARLSYRRSPVGVVLVVPAGPRTVAKRGETSVVVTGEVEELVLHALGRRSRARVEVSGPDEAVAAFA